MDESNLKSVGEKIKAHRQEQNLSIKDLADKAGCLDEYLAWVEDGQVEPPVALLIQIAKAMQLDANTFITSDDARNQRLEELAKRTEHYSYKTLTPPVADTHLMAFSVMIPPKTDHKGVGYRHEGEEYIYVLSGEVEVIVNEEKTVLSEKESIRFNSNLDHYLSNPGNRETELLVILYLP